MVPIVLDPKNVRMAVIGQGSAFARRVEQLRAGGAEGIATFDTSANEVPTVEELANIRVVFIAGVSSETAAVVAVMAKSVGALVNAEDMTEQCDFHMPAVVRRGDLLITASTAGKSPGLARKLRQSLEAEFGDEWAGIVEEVAQARQAWLANGDTMKNIAAQTEQLIEENGWLS